MRGNDEFEWFVILEHVILVSSCSKPTIDERTMFFEVEVGDDDERGGHPGGGV